MQQLLQQLLKIISGLHMIFRTDVYLISALVSKFHETVIFVPFNIQIIIFSLHFIILLYLFSKTHIYMKELIDNMYTIWTMKHCSLNHFADVLTVLFWKQDWEKTKYSVITAPFSGNKEINWIKWFFSFVFTIYEEIQ